MVQLLNFDPLNWKTYCSFSRLAEGGSTSLLGLVPSASNSEILLGQCPHLLSSSVSGEMKVVSHLNLPQALEQLGGVQALLFLVAKVSGNPNCCFSTFTNQDIAAFIGHKEEQYRHVVISAAELQQQQYSVTLSRHTDKGVMHTFWKF